MIRARFLWWVAHSARESTAEPLPRLLNPLAPFLHACQQAPQPHFCMHASKPPSPIFFMYAREPNSPIFCLDVKEPAPYTNFYSHQFVCTRLEPHHSPIFAKGGPNLKGGTGWMTNWVLFGSAKNGPAMGYPNCNRNCQVVFWIGPTALSPQTCQGILWWYLTVQVLHTQN